MQNQFQREVTISGQVRPVTVLIALVGLVVLVLGALAVHRYISERAVVSWKGTIASSAASVEPISQVDQLESVAASSSTFLNPSETLVALNQHWLDRVNNVRKEKQLRQLVIDQRLVATAGEWASEMEKRGEITHERIDGKSMHQWIDTKRLDFTKRHSENGWKTNYFVENIARFYTELSVEEMKLTLDRILADFVSEGPGGEHFESIYYLDWNSVGLGYAVHSSETEPPRVYFVFHYASLNPAQP